MNDFEYVSMGNESLIQLMQKHGITPQYASALAEYNGLPQAYASVMSILPAGTIIRVPGTFFDSSGASVPKTAQISPVQTGPNKTMLYIGLALLAYVVMS